ncbi:reticulon-4 isoform X2 [Microcaecilia unicolor]|uniref:Reticulon n=1 Tax=Microcaecilia unicolor TaxID=1415580 RepID=A0A6P7XES5_9AMPH|nr:reticulon-4 isoform X2 [Microcaecilia unicolor]
MDAYKSQSPEISSTSPQDPHRYPREPEQDEEEEDEEEEEEEEEDKPRFWEHDDDGEVLDLTGGAGDYSSHPPFTVSFPSQPRAAAAAQFPGSEGGEKVPDRSPQQAPEVPSVKPPERSPEPSIKLPERSPEPPSIKIPKWSPEPSIKPPVPRSTSEEPAEPVLPRRRGSSGSADEALFALPATSAPLYSSADKILDLQDQPCASSDQEDSPSMLLETAASLPSLPSLSTAPFKEHVFSDKSPPELPIRAEQEHLTKMDIDIAESAETLSLFGNTDSRRAVEVGLSEMELQFILPSKLEASTVDDTKEEMETPEKRGVLHKQEIPPEVHSPHLVYYARETFTERVTSDGCPSEYALQGAVKEDSPLGEDYVDFNPFEPVKMVGHETRESIVGNSNIANKNIEVGSKQTVQKDEYEFGQDNVDSSSFASEVLQAIPETYSTATFYTDAAYDRMIHPVTRAEGQASEMKTDEKRAEIEAESSKVHSDVSIAAANPFFESESHKLDYVNTDNLPASLTVASMPDGLTPDLVQEAYESEMYDGTCAKPYESKMDLVQMTSELLKEPPSPVTQLSSFEGCGDLSSPLLPDIVMEAPLGSAATSIESTNIQLDATSLEEIAPPLVNEEKIKLESEKPPSYEEAVKVPLSDVQKDLVDVKLKIMEDNKDAAFEEVETPYISIACDLIKETKGSDVYVPSAFLASKSVTKEFPSQPESDLAHQFEMSSSESDEADSIDTAWQPKIAPHEMKPNMRESPVESSSAPLIEHESKDIVDLQSASQKTWESFLLDETPIAKPKTEEKPHETEDLGKVAFSATALSDTKEPKAEDDKDARKLTEDPGTAPVLYRVATPTKLGLSVTDNKTKQSFCPEHPSVKISAPLGKSSTIVQDVPEVCSAPLVPKVGSFEEKLESAIKPPGLLKKVDDVSSSKVKSDKERETPLAASSLSAALNKASVVDLLYWRDIKKTGVVFGASLFLLLSLTVFSIVSVSAYIALALLSVSISFRIYKGVLQAVQKSDEGHPFRAYLDSNIGISEELVQKYSNVVQGHVNCTAKELRRLFLVEDLVDSLKFAVLMWIMTYVGALFNGLTLMILALISLFSIPVIYERHQAQIDHYLELVNKNIKNGIAKIQAKIPGLKRKAE